MSKVLIENIIFKVYLIKHKIHQKYTISSKFKEVNNIMTVDMSTIKINTEVKKKLENYKEKLEEKLNVSKISFSDAINHLLVELNK